LNKGVDLKINDVDVEKSLFKIVDVREMQAGRMYQIQIEAVLEKLTKGKNADKLKIQTNQKDMGVLEVPVRFEIL
jgi:hypothetical protein